MFCMDVRYYTQATCADNINISENISELLLHDFLNVLSFETHMVSIIEFMDIENLSRARVILFAKAVKLGSFSPGDPSRG